MTVGEGGGSGGESLRSRLRGGNRQTGEVLVDAVSASLAGPERVVHDLTSTGALVYERRGETQEKGGEGTLVVATDRKLVFAVDTGAGVETSEVSYTDLRAVGIDSGFLHTEVFVRIWGRGTIRFEPHQTGVAEEFVAFVDAASDVWDRVVAALQDARQYIAELPDRLVENEDEAVEIHAAAREAIETARERAATAPGAVTAAIEARIETVERELARTRAEGRLDRARELHGEAGDLVRANRFAAAVETHRRARSDLELVTSLIEEWGFDLRARLGTERERLADQRTLLESRPLERAEEALARAHEAETRNDAVRAWEHALACYREALTLGWGTDIDIGDTDALRMQVQWLVGRVVERRRELADRYEAEGDTFCALAVEGVGRDRYETACVHLVAAHRLAVQYRTGDPTALRRRVRWIDEKLESAG